LGRNYLDNKLFRFKAKVSNSTGNDEEPVKSFLLKISIK
jgi:hypothetical protein